MKRLLPFLVTGAFLSLASPAVADMIPQTCKTVHTEDKSVPADLAVELRDISAHAVRICRSDIPQEKGAVLSAMAMFDVMRAPNGVCWYDTVHRRLRRASPGFRSSKWTSGTDVYRGRNMMVSVGPGCPSQEDERYVTTASITPGLFARMLSYWDGLRDPKTLDAALAQLPSPLMEIDRSKFTPRQQSGIVRDQAEFLQSVRAMFLAHEPPKLTDIRIDETGVLPPNYGLTTPLGAGSVLQLNVDLGPNGLRLLSIGRVNA